MINEDTWWVIDTDGNLVDGETGQVIASPLPPGYLLVPSPRLLATVRDASKLLASLRHAVMFMEFAGKTDRVLTAEERAWLSEARTLLAQAEGRE